MAVINFNDTSKFWNSVSIEKDTWNLVQLLICTKHLSCFQNLYTFAFRYTQKKWKLNILWLKNQLAFIMDKQRAKKVVSSSLRLVDFAIRLVNSVLNLPDSQMNCFKEFKLQNNYNVLSILLIKNNAFGLVEMTFGLVYASYSLPNMASRKTNFFCSLINQVLVKYLGTCSSFNLMDFIGLCWLGLLFTIIRKAVHANWNIAIPPWSQIIYYYI